MLANFRVVLSERNNVVFEGKEGRKRISCRTRLDFEPCFGGHGPLNSETMF